MKNLLISLLVVFWSLASQAQMQLQDQTLKLKTSSTKQGSSSWNYALSTQPVLIASGLKNIKLELSHQGSWTHSVGFYQGSKRNTLTTAEISGVSYILNYYSKGNTKQNSWVWGLGGHLTHTNVKILFFPSASGLLFIPELNTGHQWVFNRITLKAGVRLGGVGSLANIELGYRL